VTEHPKSQREAAGAEVPIVFVIDDDESMRRGLTNLFESVGLRVEAFGSAPELLQKKLPDVPSCVVLDIRLRNERFGLSTVHVFGRDTDTAVLHRY
jgi:FixJ family two-component response regulator